MCLQMGDWVVRKIMDWKSMKIKDLLKKLAEYDSECEVILSKDAEGNSYSPLEDIEAAQYESETTWSGYCLGVEEGESHNAVSLWPVNWSDENTPFSGTAEGVFRCH